MKELVVSALERELSRKPSGAAGSPTRKPHLPVVHLRSGRPLDLSEFDFDDLLA